MTPILFFFIYELKTFTVYGFLIKNLCLTILSRLFLIFLFQVNTEKR